MYGLKFPLNFNSKGKLQKTQSLEEWVVQKIKFFFYTEQGSRIMRPLLGTTARRQVGKPLGTSSEVFSIEVKNGLNKIRNLRVNSVEIIDQAEESTELEIKYQITDGNTIGEISTLKIKLTT